MMKVHGGRPLAAVCSPRSGMPAFRCRQLAAPGPWLKHPNSCPHLGCRLQPWLHQRHPGLLGRLFLYLRSHCRQVLGHAWRPCVSSSSSRG